jgi:cytochrome c oxidase cbb3-type subunit 1
MFEFIKKENSAALAFITAGSFWFLIGTLYGMFSAIHLVAPEFFNNIPFLVFGRTRPTHVNTVVYGFITTTLIGCALYYMPALLKTKLWSEPLGWLSVILWNISVISGPLTFSFGISQGREYAEYIWIFDITLILSLLLLVLNIIKTITKRTENLLYVSVWYFAGAMMWTSVSYSLGNIIWHPQTGALSGILDSIFLWFWGHNLPGLLLTPLAIGAGYYVIPRVTKEPLFSHTLSLIGFWTLVMLYSHIGGHHLLQAPIPAWLKVISVTDSVLMIIPVFTVLVNWWLSARGKAGLMFSDIAGRWVIAGSIWYLLTSVQGSFQSLPTVQRITHFTNWTIGHAHIAILGFSGFIALGAAWHILPYLLHKQLYSVKLVKLQFGFVTIGLTGFFVVLTIAGLIQGEAWYNGEVVYRVLPELKPYMVFRALSGVFIITAAVVGFYNLIMTIRKGVPLNE